MPAPDERLCWNPGRAYRASMGPPDARLAALRGEIAELHRLADSWAGVGWLVRERCELRRMLAARVELVAEIIRTQRHRRGKHERTAVVQQE